MLKLSPEGIHPKIGSGLIATKDVEILPFHGWSINT